ncbi:hypothetical protein DENSPDRAFT_571422 [Dentipellis sp. KUC8613]|nr:hypothetical protein DENSPDRAFT_571422 [Dentipellis sp. KUC8613]
MTVVTELPTTPTSTTLSSRLYQEEIFLKARESNVIAALGTGSGKTYISTMLMSWISTQDCARGKIIVFLVPKKALVEQQGEFIGAQTGLRVTQIHGDTAPEMTERDTWSKIFSDVDVMVMTAQLFLNAVTHSHWSLPKVSLLVVDECHHTRKNHPYNGIMKEYFQCPEDKRPKIFGMTASPVWRPHRPEEDLADLERNMNAKVITVNTHAEELLSHLPTPKEVLYEYPASPDAYPTYPIPLMSSRFDFSTLPVDDNIPWFKIQAKYDAALASLGPFGAELFLYSELKQRVLQLFSTSVTDEMDALRRRFLGLSSLVSSASESVTSPYHELHNVLSEYEPFYQDAVDEATLPSACSFSLEWCTPKLQALVETVLSHYKPEFQAIVFVDQRHIAATLAKVISRIPQLKDTIRCSECVGHGNDDFGAYDGMGDSKQREVVRAFRSGKLNLLIATPVAEEGLDFPACDLVVRFDSIQHMVGYVQSRGRARHKLSTFVIMVQEGDSVELARYRLFVNFEPEVKRLYQKAVDANPAADEQDADDYVHPADLAERERFLVPSTGAVLTYNTAIALLNHLCALIPCDQFTLLPKPKYTGDFVSKLQLPAALPLPPEHLTYTGPRKQSKKEAKRAVAFQAVKALHALDVFDDYLLPARSPKDSDEDIDGRPILDVRHIPDMMNVDVWDPWTLGEKLWMHVVEVEGRRTAALMTGTSLPPVELPWDGQVMRIYPGELMAFDEDDEHEQRKLLQEYTNLGIWWCITSRPIALPLSCFLVPIDVEFDRPDYTAMERVVKYPLGNRDWRSINASHYDRILVMNHCQHGRPYVLHKIRHDLSPLSKPLLGAVEDGFDTYREYYMYRWTRRGRVPDIPMDGLLVEAKRFERQTSGAYHLPHCPPSAVEERLLHRHHFLPFACCKWFGMSEDMFLLYRQLPRLLRRVTDVWRVSRAKWDLGLPAIKTDLLIEAFTLPAAGADFSNQRMETLGDSVLKLAASVHLFHKFPFRHEGQLDTLRRRCVANKTLLSRAKEVGLEHYLTSEGQNVKTWRYIVSEGADPTRLHASRHVRRRFDRRSLQDCMEATLGASYLTGGIPMALHAGTALGLNFGGTVPWSVRYSRNPESAPIPSRFDRLQETLMYHFHRPELLIEAMTHPSFPSNNSYQRLEFLGDAIIDFVVMTYLFKKYPSATSHQLSWPRSRAVCAPPLAYVAVKHLGLHKLMMANNSELSIAIDRYAPILEQLSPRDIVLQSWAHDPPKAISDILESLVAAIFVDSAYNFHKTAVIVEGFMSDILDVLSPDMPADPVSELMVWTAKSGCRRIKIPKSRSHPDSVRIDTINVFVHDVLVAGPVTATNVSVAKAFACEHARTVLQNQDSDLSLARLCDCHRAIEMDQPPSPTIDAEAQDPETAEDDTEPGYLAVAQKRLEEFEAPVASVGECAAEPEEDEEDERGNSVS